MANADGSIRIKAIFDDSDALKQMQGLGGKIGGIMGGVAKTTAVAMGAAAAGVAAIGKAAIASYGEYEQLVGGVETLFKDSAGIVQDYADNAYKTAGMSANEYMNTVTSFSASLLQGLGGDTEAAAHLADRAITDMADNANKMGTDIGMIQNAYQGFAKQNYTMLDNLKLGYGGTQAEMARLINDSGVLGDTFVATANNVNQVSFDKIIQAIGVIQDRMGITGTTAAEASQTIQGSISAMQGAWKNFVTGITDPNQDLGKLADNLADSIGTVADNLVPRIQEMLPRLADGLTQLVNKLIPYIPETLDALLPSLIDGAAALLNSFVNILPALITTAVNALPQLAEAAVSIVSNLVSALGQTGAALLDAGIQVAGQLAEGLRNGIPQLMAAIPQMLSSLVSFIGDNLPAFLQAGTELINAIVDGFIAGIPGFLEQLPLLIDNIAHFLADGSSGLLSAGISIVTNLVKGIIQAIPLILEQLPTIIENLTTTLAGFWPEIIRNGFELIKQLGEGIFQALPDLLALIPTLVLAIVEAIGNAFVMFVEVGAGIVEALWEGISGMTDWLWNQITNFAKSIVDGLKNAITGSASTSLSLSGGTGGGARMPSYAAPMSLDAIPHLASGAVISPNHEFLAVLGDQRSGTNIEAPMDTIKQGVLEALNEAGGITGGEVLVKIMFTGSNAQLARVLQPEITVETARRGPQLVTGGAY